MCQEALHSDQPAAVDPKISFSVISSRTVKIFQLITVSSNIVTQVAAKKAVNWNHHTNVGEMSERKARRLKHFPLTFLKS